MSSVLLCARAAYFLGNCWHTPLSGDEPRGSHVHQWWYIVDFAIHDWDFVALGIERGSCLILKAVEFVKLEFPCNRSILFKSWLTPIRLAWAQFMHST